MHIRLRQLLISISIFVLSIFFSNCLICKGVSNVISLMFEALGNYATVKEKLEDVNTGLEHMTVENENLKNKISDMTGSQQKLKSQLQVSNDSLIKTQQENEKLKNNLKNVINENKIALDTINKLKSDIVKKEESYNEVCKEKEKILGGKKKVEDDIVLMHQKIDVLEKNNNDLENKNKRLLIDAKNEKMEFMKINKENAGIKKEYDEMKKANVLLAKKNSSLQNSKEYLLEENKEKTEKISILQTEINRLQAELAMQKNNKYCSIGDTRLKLKKSNDRYKDNNISKKITESQRQQQNKFLLKLEQDPLLIKQNEINSTVNNRNLKENFFIKKLPQKQSVRQKYVDKKNANANKTHGFIYSEKLFSGEKNGFANVKNSLYDSFNSSEIEDSNSFISINSSVMGTSGKDLVQVNQTERNANNNGYFDSGNSKKNFLNCRKIIRSRKENNVIQRDENTSEKVDDKKTVSNNKNSKNLEPRHQGSQVYNRRRVVHYGFQQGLEKVNSDNNKTEWDANNNSYFESGNRSLKKNLNSMEISQMKKNDDGTDKNVLEKTFYKKIETPVKGNLVRQQNSTVRQRMRSHFSEFKQVSEPGDNYKNYINSINFSDDKQRIIRDAARNLLDSWGKLENENNDGNKIYNNITNINNGETE